MSKTDVNMEAKEFPRTGTNGGGGSQLQKSEDAAQREGETRNRERGQPGFLGPGLKISDHPWVP